MNKIFQWIVFVCAFFCALDSHGQYYQPYKTPMEFEKIKVKDLFLPRDTVPLSPADTGKLAVKNGMLYMSYRNGSIASWKLAGGGVGVGITYLENGAAGTGQDTLLTQADAETFRWKSIGTDLPDSYKIVDAESIKYNIASYLEDNIPLYNEDWGGHVSASHPFDANYTITMSPTPANHHYFTGVSPDTLFLPSLSSSGNMFFLVKNQGEAVLTIDAAGSDQIFTNSMVGSFTIPVGGAVIIGNNGDNWEVFDTGGGILDQDASFLKRGYISKSTSTSDVQELGRGKKIMGSLQVGGTHYATSAEDPTTVYIPGIIDVKSDEDGGPTGRIRMYNEYGSLMFDMFTTTDDAKIDAGNLVINSGPTAIGLSGTGYLGGAYIGKPGVIDPSNGSDVTLMGSGSVSIPHGAGRYNDFFGNNSGGTNDHGNFGLHGSTDDNAVYMGVREGGGGFMRMITEAVLRAKTSNATPTTKTITIDNETAGIIEISISASEYDPSFGTAGLDGTLTGKKILRFVKNGGTLTLGSSTTQLADEATGVMSTCTWSFTASGNQIVATLTGAASTDIIWNLYYKILPAN